MTILGAFMIASVVLTSCGSGGMESDAQKMCDFTCESQELSKEMIANPTDLSLSSKAFEIGNALNAFVKEMEVKYDEDERKEFALYFLKCDCLQSY